MIEYLAELPLGDSAVIDEIVQVSSGSERRRLYNLGLTTGTEITAELLSPGGDPIAYRIRGTLIALRKEQAELIRIKTDEE
jgi:Fe2+ transport system protein FeoA